MSTGGVRAFDMRYGVHRGAAYSSRSPPLPLSASTRPRIITREMLKWLRFDFCSIEAKPANLIGGNNSYDSYDLSALFEPKGVEMIAPHRSKRRSPSSKSSVGE